MTKCIICNQDKPNNIKTLAWEFVCDGCKAKKLSFVPGTPTNANPLLTGMKKETNYTLTENLADTHKSTLNYLLDFFSLGGALRSRDTADIIRLWERAWGEDKLLALKCLFYFRDIRGGQGERRTFRTVINHLGNMYPDVVKKNLVNVPEYGRWDDLYSVIGTTVEPDMFKFMLSQLQQDLDPTNDQSLLAKWLKSENTSSKLSKILGKKTRVAFGYTPKVYRQTLSRLRARLNVVESKMCAKEWSAINYPAVPSRAAMIYRNAFKKHDEERYQAFLDAVEKGEAKINTGTLYPYDLIRIAAKGGANKTIELQWENLPDYTEGEESSIVVCDTSGSMCGTRWGMSERTVEPIHVAISLAMYFAERAKGPFQGHFITFSSAPELQRIVGHNIYERYRNLSRAHWEGNTNLQAVFDLILSTAVANRVPEEDMLKKVYIISDMQFDSCVRWGQYGRGKPRLTNFDAIKSKYARHGYDLPTLVFWNVDARSDQAPVTQDEKGVFLVSGCSPSIFESLMKSKAITPVDLMLDVLNDPKYDRIVI